MAQACVYRRVVVLDTMTLHFARLCFDYADEHGLDIVAEEKALAHARCRLAVVEDVELRKSLKIGLETIALLAQHDVQVEYTDISELELLTGIAEGEARLSLAREGVPHRMWSTLREKEIRERLRGDELGEIHARIGCLLPRLEGVGISITKSDLRRVGEVMELAREICRRIYMRELDSIILGGAIAVEADYLLTADEYFRETLNLVQGSDIERYRAIGDSLRQVISQVLLEVSDDFELPRAFMVTQNGKLKGISRFP